MTLEEFKIWVKRHDRTVGIYKSTLTFKEKRKYKLENFPSKLLPVAQWLIDKGIDFQVLESLCLKKGKPLALMTDLYVPQYKIAIRYVNEDKGYSKTKAQWYYYYMRRKSFPLFARSGESVEFILEKLQNCIKDFGNWKKYGLVGDIYELVPQKRERTHRVVVEKVERKRHTPVDCATFKNR